MCVQLNMPYLSTCSPFVHDYSLIHLLAGRVDGVASSGLPAYSYTFFSALESW